MKKYIYIIFNAKGGVAKTTLAREIAACMAYIGHTVLAIDFDDQGTLTHSLGLPFAQPGGSALNTMLAYDRPDVGGFVYPVTKVDRLFVLPGNDHMDEDSKVLDREAEDSKNTDTPQKPYLYLTKLIERLPYDYIVIDCPNRATSPLVANAFFTGGEIICPVNTTDTSSIRCADLVFKALEKYRKYETNGYKLATFRGAVINEVPGKPRVIEEQNRELIKEIFKDKVFKKEIRESQRVRDVLNVREPMINIFEGEEATNDMLELTKEVLSHGK